MREPLTLSRPIATRTTTNRPTGTVSAGRGPAFRGSEAFSEPGALSRRVGLLVGLFVVGIALGWLATLPFVGRASQPVNLPEYAAVVAQLYQRDHNLDLAKERLSLYGKPADLAVLAARDSRVQSSGDRAAVSALAEALGKSVPADSRASGSQAVTGGTTASSVGATSNRRNDGPSWIGPVIAFVVALGLGAIVLLRTAGLSAASLGAPSLRRNPAGSAARRPASAPPRNDAPRPSADAAPTAAPVSVPERAAKPFRAERVGGDTRGVARARIPSFQSVYHLGDDPYDEIHPITDPATGGLIAACGLSAALKHNGSGSQYFAFTAWLQNYAGDERLNAAGLIAPGAQGFAADQIQGWVRGGQIDTLVPIEKGMRAEIGTEDLGATVTVLDAEFGDEPGAPRSYLRKLVVRFDVQSSG